VACLCCGIERLVLICVMVLAVFSRATSLRSVVMVVAGFGLERTLDIDGEELVN